MKYIDVLTAAATTRKIQSYESTIELSVRSSAKVSCFDASLKLREAVVVALKEAGFDDSQINEGGGDVSHTVYSSFKSVSHEIIVKNMDMRALVKGMAAVEQMLAQRKQPFFSRIKESFAFRTPVPIYAPSVSPAEALEGAMQRARQTAEAIAAAHGEVVDSLEHVFEVAAASQQSAAGHDEMDYAPSSEDDDQTIGAITNYVALDQPTGRGTRRFRVRFSLAQGK